MQMLKMTAAFLAVTVLAGLTGCASNSTVKIGHAGPTSGAIAHLGKDNENGARMAIDELNAQGVTIAGKKVKFELVTVDDGANPGQAVAVARTLVAANVNGVVGHLTSGATVPASRIYFDAGIPQISPSATNPVYTMQGFNTAFRITQNDAQLAEALGHYAVDNLAAARVAVIDDSTAYGTGLNASFSRVIRNSSGRTQIVAAEHTSNNATDFNAILTKIQAANPDVIFFGGMDSVAGPILKQMRAMGIRARFIGGDGICTNALPTLAASAIDDSQVYCAEAGEFTDWGRPALNQWRAAYKNKFGVDVQIYAPATYDAVMIMVDAMKRAGSTAPKDYLPYLAKTKYHGITGDIEFDRNGDNEAALSTLYTYIGGKRTKIGAASATGADKR
jgi:branched-chain amino acid transport system substrate-binding protein